MLTEIESKKLKEVIRENLQAIHDFCEAHGLTYYLSDGTLLGAIRHKGMIPWDDDADICMPRADYQKFIKISGMIPKPYSLKHFILDKEFVHSIIKFVNNETSITELYPGGEYSSGIWVDIFPLDGTFRNIYLRRLHFSVVKILRALFFVKIRGVGNMKSGQFPFDKKILIKKALSFFLIFVPVGFLFYLMDSVAGLKKFSKSDLVGNLYTGIGIRASHEREWFESKIKVNFDGKYFYAPSGYDGYLKNLYGSYMIPPDVSARNSHNIKQVIFHCD